MSVALWVTAVITLLSAGVSFGFSVAAVRRGSGQGRTSALYTLARNSALLVVAVVALTRVPLADSGTWMTAAVALPSGALAGSGLALGAGARASSGSGSGSVGHSSLVGTSGLVEPSMAAAAAGGCAISPRLRIALAPGSSDLVVRFVRLVRVDR